jgi:hypothetical protein
MMQASVNKVDQHVSEEEEGYYTNDQVKPA